MIQGIVGVDRLETRPKEFLPKYFSKARIMTFNYNSRWQFNASVRSVHDYGKGLLAAVCTVRKLAVVCCSSIAKHPLGHLNLKSLHQSQLTFRWELRRPIISIRHSFGGIIIITASLLYPANYILSLTWHNTAR